MGCRTAENHEYTASFQVLNRKYFIRTPVATRIPKSRAVVVDCEMAGVLNGGNEVIQVCMTDYVTGKVLLNSLVNPTQKILGMRTAIHGVSKGRLRDAVARGEALSGWRGARDRCRH